MSKKSNYAQMQKLVLQYQSSGKSQKSFALVHGITEGKLHYWLRKLSADKERGDNSTGPDFVPLQIAPDSSVEDKAILIQLPNGTSVEIPL